MGMGAPSVRRSAAAPQQAVAERGEAAVVVVAGEAEHQGLQVGRHGAGRLVEDDDRGQARLQMRPRDLGAGRAFLVPLTKKKGRRQNCVSNPGGVGSPIGGL